MRTLPCLVLALALAGCGGPAVEPLLSGSVSGSYDGNAFTAVNGYAVPRGTGSLIILGDGNLYCGSEDAGDPPNGRNAAIGLPTFEVGTYGSVSVQMLQNVTSFESAGTNSGVVTLTEVTGTSVAGDVSFAYTDDSGRSFSLSGTFEVTLCPE